jgi:enoyl-CoA hydratase/carnithine racemase
MRGRLLDADEAAALGMVTTACEAEELGDTVEALANELTALAPLTLAAIKDCMLDGLDTDLDSGLVIESYALTRVAVTEDAKEGVRSFLESRPPKFVGR